jgi:hypothetical protein
MKMIRRLRYNDFRTLPFLCLIIWGADLQAQQSPAPVSTQADSVVHHSLRVRLDPYSSLVSVEDNITLPPGLRGREIGFLLNANLAMINSSVRVIPQGGGESNTAVGINSTGADTADSTRYSTILQARANGELRLRYEGNILQQAQQTSAQYSQSFSETSGIITAEGVYLNGASLWVPSFGEQLVTFDLQVEFAPQAAGWTAVSPLLKGFGI